MIKTLVMCDFCEKPLPVTEGHNVFIHRTKEWDTRLIFPHLCESCAEKLDKVMRLVKAHTEYETLLAAKFAKVNAERKEQLGTKG